MKIQNNVHVLRLTTIGWDEDEMNAYTIKINL